MINIVSQLQSRVLSPQAGPTLSFLGVTIAYKMSSADTNGAWALLEYVAPPKFAGPPLHWHNMTSELFYVLEGALTFRQGDEIFRGEPGAMAYIPPGILHTFSNQEDKPARFLTFISPGGLEGYFKELALLAQSEPSWPPQDMSKLRTLYEKYDQNFPDR